jgi:hypothetical protein
MRDAGGADRSADECLVPLEPDVRSVSGLFRDSAALMVSMPNVKSRRRQGRSCGNIRC